MKKKLTAYLMTLLMLMLTLFSGCGAPAENVESADDVQTDVVVDVELDATIDPDGWYYSTEDVALYLYTYGELPDNFITKKEAQSMGWDNKKGNLWEVADGMCIGGDHFGNYEGLLPEEDEYTECDVNYEGGYRGAERIIFSDDGDIYYTGDHYKSFEQLY